MSMSFNQVKTGTMAPYINSTIDSSLKRALNLKAVSACETTTLFNNTLAGVTVTVPQASSTPVNVFTENFAPTFSATNSGKWTTNTDDHTNANYGILVYNGKPVQAQIELTYAGHTASVTNPMKAQLYLNGNAVDSNTTGGRGFDGSTNVTIDDKIGNGALLSPVIVGGVIQYITVLKSGSGYSSDLKVVISGNGRDASATATRNGAGGISSVSLSNFKIQESGIPLLYTPADGEIRGGSRSYVFDIIQNDALEIRINSTEAGGGNTGGTAKSFTAKLEVKLNTLTYS